jgi:hypothetical protein
MGKIPHTICKTLAVSKNVQVTPKDNSAKFKIKRPKWFPERMHRQALDQLPPLERPVHDFM